MIISGWGIFLIFATNQAVTQTVAPYPPFGLVTVTVLVLVAYLMMLGIYGSATLVSANNNLRISIYKHATEWKLLGVIGDAEVAKLIEKTVREISKHKDRLEQDIQRPLEFDEVELKKYVDFVVREVGQKGKTEPQY